MIQRLEGVQDSGDLLRDGVGHERVEILAQGHRAVRHAWIDSNSFLAQRQALSEPHSFVPTPPAHPHAHPEIAMLSLKCGINPLMRHKQNVQAPQVQQVRGGLGAHKKQSIITTSDFSKGAQEEATRSDAVPVA